MAAATRASPLGPECPGAEFAAAVASAVEKELAARASNVTEVTLGKNMLAFAAKFMNGKDQDEAATRRLIEGLDGIYVREYEFDKEGQYSMEDIEKLRHISKPASGRPLCVLATRGQAKPPT